MIVGTFLLLRDQLSEVIRLLSLSFNWTVIFDEDASPSHLGLIPPSSVTGL